MLTRIATFFNANPRFVRQFVKFGIVGTIGTLVDVGTLVFLKEVIGLNVYVANAISFTLAVLNNYTLNSRWTFGDQEKEHHRQLVQFFIVSIVGLALSSALLYFFHDVSELKNLDLAEFLVVANLNLSSVSQFLTRSRLDRLFNGLDQQPLVNAAVPADLVDYALQFR